MICREAIEAATASGLADEEGLLRQYFSTQGEDWPGDLKRALAAVPSFLQETASLLKAMKREGLTTLVVDLRGNGGGSSMVVEPFLYQMLGDQLFERPWPGQVVRNFSELYFENLSGLTPAQVRRDQDWPLFETGDYLVESRDDATLSAAQRRDRAVQQYHRLGPTIAQTVDGLNGHALFKPERLVVIVDARTFSAAVDLFFFLQHVGAVVIGVPPSQSPNTFMEWTSYTLPRRKTAGVVSHKLQTFLPSQPSAREFPIDFPLTYAIAQRYGFDPAASVRYAFDLIKSGEIDNAKKRAKKMGK